MDERAGLLRHRGGAAATGQQGEEGKEGERGDHDADTKESPSPNLVQIAKVKVHTRPLAISPQGESSGGQRDVPRAVGTVAGAVGQGHRQARHQGRGFLCLPFPPP